MPLAAPLVQNEALTHGTIECTDLAASRRFYVEFLGLDIHRPVPVAQYVYRGGPWAVVCVCVEDGEPKDQSPENHFKLAVDGPDEVDAAHAAAIAHQHDYGIRNVRDVVAEGGRRGFLLQDLNYTWWEITDADQAHYAALFDAAAGAST